MCANMLILQPWMHSFRQRDVEAYLFPRVVSEVNSLPVLLSHLRMISHERHQVTTFGCSSQFLERKMCGLQSGCGVKSCSPQSLGFWLESFEGVDIRHSHSIDVNLDKCDGITILH